MITGSCCLTCLHCDHAKGSSKAAQWEYDDAVKLLRQARECGIEAVTLTGGEPLMHPGFCDIAEAVISQEMVIDRIETNGFFVTEELLDRIEGTGHKPTIVIPHDGILRHDWLRDRKGAEGKALMAARLCVQNGFDVVAQVQVHGRNRYTLISSAKLLSRTGVSRIIYDRTRNSVRFRQNPACIALSAGEFTEDMLDYVKEYIHQDILTDIRVSGLIDVYPKEKRYRLGADESACVIVDPFGEVYLCSDMGEYFEGHLSSLGNVHSSPLGMLLQAGKASAPDKAGEPDEAVVKRAEEILEGYTVI